ncbi:MAG: hypothetical protein IIA51_00240 [Chloroflexi bacterium]|nr:hypothetical protein [Chloroflexota bacterium]
MSTPLSMQRIGDGLLLTVPKGAWNVVRPSLLQAIDERSACFRGARVALQLADRSLIATELGGLRDALNKRQIALTAILTTSSTKAVFFIVSLGWSRPGGGPHVHGLAARAASGFRQGGNAAATIRSGTRPSGALTC